MMSFHFNNPTNLIFGAGALNQLGSLAMPGQKAMVLISNGKSAKENGSLDRTLAQLEKAGVQTSVFDKIMENPVKDLLIKVK